MTHSTLNPTAAPNVHHGTAVTFPRVVVSEMIKFRTLRSTIWCFGIIVFLSMGFGFLLSATLEVSVGQALGGALDNSFTVMVATLGVNFSQLVAAVLGVLIISGEFTTGMIRSTFAAVPTRLPAVFAKVLVLAFSTFVVGLVSIVATALVTMPILSAKGIAANLLDGDVMRALVGGAGYLALIAVLAFAIGAIVRSSAGGIASALGLILVVPSVLSIVAALTRTTWIPNVSALLPSNAGAEMFAVSGSEFFGGGQRAVQGADVLTLDATQGFLVLLAWVVVLLAVAAVLTKRRDA